MLITSRLIACVAVLFSSLSLVPVTYAQKPAASDFRELDQHNLIYLTTDDGTAIIELADWLAPIHVARFKQMAQKGSLSGAGFYRVIEGFVAQAGLDSFTDGAMRIKQFSSLPLEATTTRGDGFIGHNTGGLYAPHEGILNGFNVSYDGDDRYWVNHCYGVVAAARNVEPNTAATEFYIMIGPQARHLDRNMSVFGRVVKGMDVIQKVRRGVRGETADFEPTKIIDFSIGSDLEKEQQTQLFVLRTDTEYFKNWMAERVKFKSAFFTHKPAAVVNACRYTEARTHIPN